MNRLMRLSFFALALAAPLACATGQATTNPVTAAAPAGPLQTAEAVIAGFRSQDWDAVQTRLSAKRASELDDSWYRLWVSEVEQAKDLQVTDATIAPDGQSASVRVAFRLDGTHRETTVRLLQEGGVWKWDER